MRQEHTGGPILLALDFGGTKLSAAVAAAGAPRAVGTRRWAEGTRRWLARERVFSPPHKDAQYDVQTMTALARRVLGERAPEAIGVSFGGPVDAANGRVVLSHHVPGWEDTPLRDQLAGMFGVPVSVDNDANVAALGEYAYGAGVDGNRAVASLFYVTVSTGVGGGLVLGGKIYSGADGMAGEIGHTVVDPLGPLCICGRRGCVEAMACGPAIARAAQERLAGEPGAGRILRALSGGGVEGVTAERVARAASDGDNLAREVLDRAADALGFGIGTVITLLNPERVVIGGGVSKAGDRYWSRVRAAARANSLPQMRGDVVPAALEDDAPLWGAIALAEALLYRQGQT